MDDERIPSGPRHIVRGATIAMVLGAGQGTRMGADRNKIFLPLAGRPLLAHAIGAFERAAGVDEIFLVAHRREEGACRDLARDYGLRKVGGVIVGGATRHQSERRALDALRPRILAGAVDLVLVHDGARPIVPAGDIARLLRAARTSGGALLAVPLEPGELVVEAGADGAVRAVHPAGHLWRAQTPQAFDAAALLAAYDTAARDGFEGTDTASSFEHAGRAVRVVAGSPRNIKVTTPADLLRAEALLRRAPTPPGSPDDGQPEG